MDIYEFKVRAVGNHQKWEDLPVILSGEMSSYAAKARAHRLVESMGAVKCRYNAQYSFQGHYIPGSAATQQGHRLPNNHGGKREGAGYRKNYPFISKLERLAFLPAPAGERDTYMKASPRQRVLLVLHSPKCGECGAILDVVMDGAARICNECN